MEDAALSALIVDVARVVQAELDALYAQPCAPIPGSPLDQAGLRDGFAIVDGYLRHGEAGVAFEHLLYMIREPDIALSAQSLAKLIAAAAVLGMTEATARVRTLQ